MKSKKEKGIKYFLKKLGPGNHYPKAILYLMLVFSIPATVLNIGSDIAGMGAVSNLLIPAIPSFVFSIVFTTVLTITIIKFSYQQIAGILKWLCLSVLLYIIVPFFIKVNWMDVLKHTFIPTIKFDQDYIEILVALLGTTISPYLFFWQATMEAEDVKHKIKAVVVDKQMLRDVKTDVNTGMFASNLVMFFIILTTGIVLHGNIKDISTVDQAAKALEPVVGKLSYVCFAIGVLGTGFLAIPILAGSLSYIIAETFDWKQGLDKHFGEAKGFYITIVISLAIGLVINLTGINPMKTLVYTSILYGVTAPVMIAVILHVCNNKKVMKGHTNSLLSNILGFITLIVMTVSAVMLIYFSLHH
ncbi:NRAMP family divalent metal transporter [Ferruginibacter albus]|uniref:NRAMP family divalent metal transporter n=1 Tax=Ferruginibacter albus TaxID=2875540 RepID=UPI001CC3985C|nr:divalent metal cation transporter [Ferruginibacter albus]